MDIFEKQKQRRVSTKCTNAFGTHPRFFILSIMRGIGILMLSKELDNVQTGRQIGNVHGTFVHTVKLC